MQMSLKSEIDMTVTVSKVNSNKEYQDTLKLRYQSYCIENKWLNSDDYDQEQEYDHCDAHSIHFIAVDENEGDILGCMRLIDKKPEIMNEHLFKYFEHESQLKKINAGELSRLVITHSPHQLIVLKKLFYTALNYAYQNGFEYVYLAVSELHMKILTSWKSLSINLVSKTPSTRYFSNKFEYLCLIEMKDYQVVRVDDVTF